ncbi:hypothetical protein FNF29_06503 [Cafeteria roenbergensis]|uniref:Mitochondrial carrier protein n=1 Tax=Cafeteria roenbergensis TaxID=33653 RepID=A0A5A8CA60_CAFRO|nr:hypothetical protein FNF29_06503 [Cafeteria roenbergensis]|eukprot:KAA0148721.1 hypothetical protein FNF29_06503 [Cafeteria roenbergensis]
MQAKDYAPTMLGSALSGTLARLPTHPLDTLKARLQTLRAGSMAAGARPPSALELLRTIARTEGLRGLYRGLGVTLTLGPFASVLYFTGYEGSRDALKRALPGAPAALSHLSAGLIAEALSCVLFVPVDVIKERMQVQGGRPAGAGTTYYTGTVHAITSIYRGEGLAGVYRGYWATVGSFGPFSALYFAFYEAAKAAYLGHAGPEAPRGAAQMPFWASLLSGASAGAAASVLTNPLDLVKLRLQVQRGGAGLDFGYTGLIQGLRRMAAEEGLRAMMRGAGTRVAFHTPTTAISMALFETCKDAVATSMGRR